MGNKPRRECSNCGASFKDRGPAQERCPQCSALCLRKPAPAPRSIKPSKARTAAAAEAFVRELDAATVVVDAPGVPLAAALRALAAAPLLALDAEGMQLSRTGQLTVLQVATATAVYVFDCLSLGAAAFDAPPSADGLSLRLLLEDAARTKLVWDVRRDSDALFHQYGVSLRGVLDVQLAAVAVRRAAGKTVTALPGVPQTAARYLDQGTAQACCALKQHGGDEQHVAWAQRPLPPQALRYAAADALLTHRLGAALMPLLEQQPGALQRVQRASDARVCEWRDLAAPVPQERCDAHRVAPPDL